MVPVSRIKGGALATATTKREPSKGVLQVQRKWVEDVVSSVAEYAWDERHGGLFGF